MTRTLLYSIVFTLKSFLLLIPSILAQHSTAIFKHKHVSDNFTSKDAKYMYICQSSLIFPCDFLIKKSKEKENLIEKLFIYLRIYHIIFIQVRFKNMLFLFVWQIYLLRFMLYDINMADVTTNVYKGLTSSLKYAIISDMITEYTK